MEITVSEVIGESQEYILFHRGKDKRSVFYTIAQMGIFCELIEDVILTWSTYGDNFNHYQMDIGGIVVKMVSQDETPFVSFFNRNDMSLGLSFKLEDIRKFAGLVNDVVDEGLQIKIH